MQRQIECPYCGEKTLLDVDVTIFERWDDQIRIAIFNAIKHYLFSNLHGTTRHGKEHHFQNPHDTTIRYIPQGNGTGTFEFSIHMNGFLSGHPRIRGSVEVVGSNIEWDSLIIEQVS